MQGQWLQRNCYAFLLSISLPWEVLPTVTTTAIVTTVSPVVQIKSVDRNVTTVRTTTSVEQMSNAVITNVPVVRPLLPVHTTTSVKLASSAVIANASVVRLLVPVRTTTNVDRARNAVMANALVVCLLVPVPTTTNVDRARSAVIANASVVRLLVTVRTNASVVRLLVTVRTTPIVTLERIVVGEFVRHHTVVGAAELLQALLSAQLYSSPSSFPLCPVSAVLVARTTAIVHPVLWSSPANSHNNKWSQLTHT